MFQSYIHTPSNKQRTNQRSYNFMRVYSLTNLLKSDWTCITKKYIIMFSQQQITYLLILMRTEHIFLHPVAARQRPHVKR